MVRHWRRTEASLPAETTHPIRETSSPFVLLVQGLSARDKAGDATRGASMLTVHHLNNSRSQRVLWLLEELELALSRSSITSATRRTMLASPELARPSSPLGKSPVVTDGRHHRCRETGAIVEYIVDKAAGACVPRQPERLSACVGTFWLHYAEGSADVTLADEAGRSDVHAGMRSPLLPKGASCATFTTRVPKAGSRGCRSSGRISTSWNTSLA